MLARGFMLGLASGGACLAVCAPALMVGLLGRGRTLGKSARFVLLLLAGRLVGYLAFAVIAWALGQSVTAPLGRELVTGALFVALALVMAAQGTKLVPEKELCAGGFVLARLPRNELVTIGTPSVSLATSRASSVGSAGVALTTASAASLVARRDGLASPPGLSPLSRGQRLTAFARGDVGLPLVLGLSTGVSVCPPFVVAVTEAANASSLANSLTFFTSFFVATSLYFAPALVLGPVGRREVVAQVARLATLIASGYYLYRGVLLIFAGFAGVPG